MIQVRIHGRGGQGVVTAAEMLSVAAFLEGRHAQAFPSFGSERTGAPVVAFCRIDDKEIRLREPIQNPDILIVQDATLFKALDVLEGLSKDGFLLVNTARELSDIHLDAVVARIPAGPCAGGAGHRAGAGPHQPPGTQHRTARRLYRAHRRGDARLGDRRHPPHLSRARSARPMSGRPARPMTLVAAHIAAQKEHADA